MDDGRDGELIGTGSRRNTQDDFTIGGQRKCFGEWIGKDRLFEGMKIDLEENNDQLEVNNFQLPFDVLQLFEFPAVFLRVKLRRDVDVEKSSE